MCGCLCLCRNKINLPPTFHHHPSSLLTTHLSTTTTIFLPYHPSFHSSTTTALSSSSRAARLDSLICILTLTRLCSQSIIDRLTLLEGRCARESSLMDRIYIRQAHVGILWSQSTMGQNQVILRHPIIHCPTSEGVSKVSERANE